MHRLTFDPGPRPPRPSLDPKPGVGGPKQGLWGGWLSNKPFKKELAMQGLTFDPGQRRVLLLVCYKKRVLAQNRSNLLLMIFWLNIINYNS